MTENEFREKMRELGYSEEHIQEQVDFHNEFKKNGINIPLDLDCIEKPIEY